ncbi:MAG: PAS domain S-box protein [Candidatus Korobacteraceae bacterium]
MQDLTDERISPLSEQQAFGLMFEQAGFGIAQVSLDGQWLAVNQSLCDILGYSRPELLSRTLQEVTRFDDIETELANCRRLLSGESQSFSTEKRHLRADGRVLWLKAMITLVRDDRSAEPSSYLAAVEDLTPHKKEVHRVQIDGVRRLKRQAQFNESMTRILTGFTTCTSAEVDASVVAALQYTAEFIGVDHAHVLIFSPDRTAWSATHEWCGSGVDRQGGNYQNIPVGTIPWSESKVLAGEVVRISTLEDYPPEAAVERRSPDVQEGQQSILLVPIHGAAGVIAGAVGFDSHARSIAWSNDDVARCRMVGDAIATVLERRRAEQALRRSEEKFSKAFEASPAITSIVRTRDRRYLEVNRAFEQHTGFLRTEVLGRSIAEVGHLSDLRSLNHAFEKALAQGSVRNTEARLRTKMGEALIVLLSAEIIEFDGQSCVLTVAEDITERKQAEDALRESEERFRVMADSAPIMMWMSGVDKGCTDFNRGWLEFTGRTSQQEIGDGWISGVHPADLEKCLHTYHAAFDARQPFTMEYRLRHHDGEYRWIADTGVPRLLMDGRFVGYIGCCVDIDDQKQAELARTDLSRRLMTAQEAERTRIARELHDGIGQSLALLGIQMQRAGQPASLRDGKRSLGIPELCGKVKEIGAQVSRLSHQLHSSELEFLGLAVAVKGLCREFSEQYRIKVNCVCTGVPAELNSDVSLCFLRVVQEALHNVAKHSRASAVEVEVTGAVANITLAISDNGVGFEMNKVRQTAGLGMVSMRERMHLIGGEFTISSSPGSGTKILARAPLLNGAP